MSLNFNILLSDKAIKNGISRFCFSTETYFASTVAKFIFVFNVTLIKDGRSYFFNL